MSGRHQVELNSEAKRDSSSNGPGRLVMPARAFIGDKVVNTEGDDLGKIESVVLDVQGGDIAYAVLSFGGFLGLGEKLFAIPWQALKLDAENRRFILDVDKDRLEDAPGFDKHDWPSMADLQWAASIHYYYHVEPYWNE